MSNSFLWRRLHSLLGLFPIGVFLFVHMFINSLVLKGAESYNMGVAMLHNIPYLFVVEMIIIFIPVLIHAIYGVYVVYLTKNNVFNYNYYRNWLFYLQRITALITLAFVVWHVLILRFSSDFIPENAFTIVTGILDSSLVVVLYFIGMIASFAHFSNGLWSFFVTWGITVGEKAQRVAAYVCFIIFVLLTFVGINALLAFL